MNLSQHLFMPLEAKLAQRGYYGASGTLVTTGATALNYRSYPLLSVPQSPTVNIFQTFNNYASTKLRTWSSSTPSQQNTTAYTPEFGTVTAMDGDFALYTGSDYKDDYWVRLLFWKEPVTSLSRSLNITKIKHNEEDVI